MKRSLRFAHRIGTLSFEMAPGQVVEIPLFPGILKHAASGELAELLSSPAAIRKYTCEALRCAAWPILREFPRQWLRACLSFADVRPGRRRALEYLLEAAPATPGAGSRRRPPRRRPRSAPGRSG